MNTVALTEIYSVNCDRKFIVIVGRYTSLLPIQIEIYLIWTFTAWYLDGRYFSNLFTYKLFWNLLKVIILKFSTLINSIYICSGAWTTSEEKGFSRWCKCSNLNADLSVSDLVLQRAFGNVFLPFYDKLLSFSLFFFFFQLIKDKNNDLKNFASL